MGDIWTIYSGYMPPPPLFKSVRFPGYAWNAIFSKNTWYGDLKSNVYTIYRRYIGYDGGYMDDIYGIYVYFTLLHILLPTYLLTATYYPNCWQSIANTNDNFQKYTPQLCARRAHRNPPTYIYPLSFGMIYPIRTYIFNWHIRSKLLAAYIQ